MTNLKELCGRRWRVTDDGTDDPNRADSVWCLEIKGRRGCIYPYGHGGALAVRLTTAGARTGFKALGVALAHVQDGDWEQVYTFDPRHVDAVARVIGARRRRQLTPEQAAAGAARLNRARLSRKLDSKPVSPLLVTENGGKVESEAGL